MYNHMIANFQILLKFFCNDFFSVPLSYTRLL